MWHHAKQLQGCSAQYFLLVLRAIMAFVSQKQLWLAIGFGLWLAGLALFFEIVRPLRNLEADGPLAIICWVAGLLSNGYGYYKGHARFSNGLIAILHALCLLAVGWLVYVLTPLRLF